MLNLLQVFRWTTQWPTEVGYGRLTTHICLSTVSNLLINLQFNVEPIIRSIRRATQWRTEVGHERMTMHSYISSIINICITLHMNVGSAIKSIRYATQWLTDQRHGRQTKTLRGFCNQTFYKFSLKCSTCYQVYQMDNPMAN